MIAKRGSADRSEQELLAEAVGGAESAQSQAELHSDMERGLESTGGSAINIPALSASVTGTITSFASGLPTAEKTKAVKHKSEAVVDKSKAVAKESPKVKSDDAKLKAADETVGQLAKGYKASPKSATITHDFTNLQAGLSASGDTVGQAGIGHHAAKAANTVSPGTVQAAQTLHADQGTAAQNTGQGARLGFRLGRIPVQIGLTHGFIRPPIKKWRAARAARAKDAADLKAKGGDGTKLDGAKQEGMEVKDKGSYVVDQKSADGLDGNPGQVIKTGETEVKQNLSDRATQTIEDKTGAPVGGGSEGTAGTAAKGPDVPSGDKLGSEGTHIEGEIDQGEITDSTKGLDPGGTGTGTSNSANVDLNAIQGEDFKPHETDGEGVEDVVEDVGEDLFDVAAE